MMKNYENEIETIISKANSEHLYNNHILNKKMLINRLLYDENESTGRKYEIVSTFKNEEIMRKCLIRALKIPNIKKKILDYINDEDFKYSNKVVFCINFGTEVIGYGIARNTNFNTTFNMSKMILVIKRTQYHDYFYIVSAYPVPNEEQERSIKNARDKYLKNK